MNDETDMDLIRALSEERLAPPDRARVRALLASDPRLATLAEEFRAVHALTAPLEDEPPVCRTTFEDLERALPVEASLWRRRVAAAAAVMTLASAAWFGLSAWSDARPLTLAVIDLAPAPVVAETPTVPAGVLELADYDPRGPEGVAWLDDFATAAWLSEASGRPLLVFGGLSGCTMCACLEEQVFSAQSVVDLAERYVPMRFDLASLPQAEAQSLMARGYPFLEVWSAEFEPLHRLSRRPEPEFFVESMREGLMVAEAEGDLATWDELRGFARMLESGRSDESRGRLAGAQDSYASLARAESKLYRELGTSGLARISAEARAALLEAREAADSDPAAAAEVLRRALERYDGTEYAADLRAVLERLERSGHFPLLRS